MSDDWVGRLWKAAKETGLSKRISLYDLARLAEAARTTDATVQALRDWEECYRAIEQVRGRRLLDAPSRARQRQRRPERVNDNAAHPEPYIGEWVPGSYYLPHTEWWSVRVRPPEDCA